MVNILSKKISCDCPGAVNALPNEVVNVTPTHGWHPLVCAIAGNSFEAAEKIINNGFCKLDKSMLNKPLNTEGETTLMRLVSRCTLQHRSIHILEKILQTGVDINQTDNAGRSLLYYAIKADNSKAALLLLEKVDLKTEVAQIIFNDKLPDKEFSERFTIVQIIYQHLSFDDKKTLIMYLRNLASTNINRETASKINAFCNQNQPTVLSSNPNSIFSAIDLKTETAVFEDKKDESSSADKYKPLFVLRALLQDKTFSENNSILKGLRPVQISKLKKLVGKIPDSEVMFGNLLDDIRNEVSFTISDKDLNQLIKDFQTRNPDNQHTPSLSANDKYPQDLGMTKRFM